MPKQPDSMASYRRDYLAEYGRPFKQRRQFKPRPVRWRWWGKIKGHREVPLTPEWIEARWAAWYYRERLAKGRRRKEGKRYHNRLRRRLMVDGEWVAQKPALRVF